MPTVDIPDQGVSVDFPDSMSQEDIRSVLRRKFGKPPPEGGPHTEAGDLPRDLFQPAMGDEKVLDRPDFKDLSANTPLKIKQFPQRESTTAGGPRTAVPDVSDIGSEAADLLRSTFVSRDPIKFGPDLEIKKSDHPAVVVGKEAVNLAKGIPEFFTTPLGIETAATGGVAPTLTAAAFTADMLYNLGKQIKETYSNWDQMDRSEKWKALTDIGGTTVMAWLTGKHTAEGVLDKTVPARVLAKQIEQAPLTPAPMSTSALVMGGERTPPPLDRVAEMIRPVAPLTAAAVAETAKVEPPAPKPEIPPEPPPTPTPDVTPQVTEEAKPSATRETLTRAEPASAKAQEPTSGVAAPETPLQKPRQSGKAFGSLIEKGGRNLVEELLANWNDSVLSEDGTRITWDDTRSGTGKMSFTKTEFFNWLFSDEAMKVSNDPDWISKVTKARQAVGEAPKPSKPKKGPNARENETPATVHGDLQSSPIEGKGEVPAKESSPGVQPQAEAKAEDVRPPVAQAKTLTPAIITEEGQTVTGPNHATIRTDAALKGLNAVFGHQEGFVDENGQFITRAEGAQWFKQKTGRDPAVPGELHSEDLRDAGLLKHLEEEKPAEPSKPAAEPTPEPAAEGKVEAPKAESGADVTGVAQRVREKVAAAGQEELAPTGEGISAPDSVERGEAMLAKDPAAAEKAMADFEADPTKALSADAMALARAHLRQLAIRARQAEQQFGINSQQYEAAFKARSDWAARAKKMQTEWHKTGMAQQGEQDIDTGSFTGLRSAYVDDTGKDFTPSQAESAKNLAARVKAAEAAEAKAKAELKAHLEKQQLAPKTDPWVLEVADRIAKRVSTAADEARKRLAERRTRQGKVTAGVDPTLLANLPDYAIIGAEKIVKGASEFLHWADEMRKELGEMDDGFLRTVYDAARKHLTGEIGSEPGATPERTASFQEHAGILDIAAAEQKALDAANKTVRENAIRLANAENKTRIARSQQEREVAKVQEDAARQAHEASVKSAREAAIKLSDAENKAREKEASERPPNDQEIASKKALDAANEIVRKAAAAKAEAENKARTAKAGAEKNAAEVDRKAAQKKLDEANAAVRQAAIDAAKAENDARINPEKRVWAKVKEYLDKGEDSFDDMRNKVATDLGMSVKQVTDILTKGKRAKFLADDVWKKQQALRRFQEQAKRWLKSTQTPGYQRALALVPRTLFALKVGFHGTVALGTHAPAVAFQPQFWGMYVRDFGKMYRMVGSSTYYEMQVQDLLRRPNYMTARRAGLQNDPSTFEEYAIPGVGQTVKSAVDKISPTIVETFDKLTGMGNRGYSVLKILRQDMFDQHWNSLPKTGRTPDMAKAIADGVNHATGVVKGAAPTGANIALFAPRLEASRVMWLAGDPLRAAATFLNWKDASQADKYFAVQQVKEKAWTAGTLFGLLALNQGVLSLTGSNQKVNLTDPFKSDFLKFKAAGMTASYGNAMISMARLPVRLYKIRSSDGGKLKNLIYPDEDTYTVLGEYARSQMSPFASLALDLWLKADWQNRPLPNSERPVPKRLKSQKVKPYTWPEFWSEQVLPIPAEEAMREVWKDGMGMNDEQVNNMFKAIATISVMSATGARLTDDVDVQPGHKTKKK